MITPAPKPRRSAKRKAAQQSPLSRKTPMKRGSRLKPRGKKYGQKQTKAMGPRARRIFVASLPCAACGIVGYSANAHLMGALGKGIKKDYRTIGPLCGPRPSDTMPGFLYHGCHRWYDTHRAGFMRHFPTFDAEKVAAETEAAWQAFKGAKS